MRGVALLCLIVVGTQSRGQPPAAPVSVNPLLPIHALPGPDTQEKKPDPTPKDKKVDGKKSAEKSEEKAEPKADKKSDESHSAAQSLEDWFKPTFELRGRIEVDAVVAAQPALSKAVIGDLQNGYGFRRVRLGAQGTIRDSARWVSEVELAGGTVRLRDVYIGLLALPGVNEVRVGYFREPFSLEGMTSSNYITFLERSPANQVDPARNWGICGYWRPENERLLYSLGLFRNGTNNGGQSLGDQDTWSTTTRLTGLPVYDPDGAIFQLVHLGGAFSFRNPVNGVVSFAPSPGSNLLTVDDSSATPFLPPVSIPANSQQLYNLEAAQVVGPLTLQAEWYASVVQQTGAGPVFFHGFYTDAAYFLTGEHRGYDRTRGAFDGVRVLRPVFKAADGRVRGCGAFEIAVRYAFVDATSPNLAPPQDGSLSGGILHQMTLGFNWYLNDNTRLMFNYTAASTDAAAAPPVSAHLFSARAAIYW